MTKSFENPGNPIPEQSHPHEYEAKMRDLSIFGGDQSSDYAEAIVGATYTIGRDLAMLKDSNITEIDREYKTLLLDGAELHQLDPKTPLPGLSNAAQFTHLLQRIEGYCGAIDRIGWKEHAEKVGLPELAQQVEPLNIIELFGDRKIAGVMRMRRDPDHYHHKTIAMMESTTLGGNTTDVKLLPTRMEILGTTLAIYESFKMGVVLRPDLSRGQVQTLGRLSHKLFDSWAGPEETHLKAIKAMENFYTGLVGNVIDEDSLQGGMLKDLKVLNKEVNNIREMCHSILGDKSQTSVESQNQNEIKKPKVSPEEERQAKEREDLRLKNQEKLDTAASEYSARQGLIGSEWSISSKALKSMDLSELQYALVNGVIDEDGNNVLDGRSKTEAKQLIGIMLFLQKSDEESLEDTLKTEQNNLKKLQELRNGLDTTDLTEEDYLTALSKAPQLKDELAKFKDEWMALRGVVASKWVNGKQLVDDIDRLLFPELESIVVPEQETSDEIIENNVVPLNGHDAEAIAEQLDQVILPPNPTTRDIEEVVERMQAAGENTEGINWDRLKNLATISEEFGGRLFRSKKESLGGAPAYFVTFFSTRNDHYAVAETPAKGNATYIIAESQAAGSCLEVLTLSKEDARDAGAMRIIHRGEDNDSAHHLQKIRESIHELETIKRAA